MEVWAWEPTPIAEWKDLVDYLTTQVPFFDQANTIPVTLYGHSLGSLVAFEVACKLQSEGTTITLNEVKKGLLIYIGKHIAGVLTGASGSPDKPAAFSTISGTN